MTHTPWYRRRVLTDLRPSTARLVLVVLGGGIGMMLIMGWLTLITVLAAMGHP